MGDIRPPTDEQDLRETREDLLDRHCELQGQLGGLPSRRVAELFIDPIIGKVERECDDTRHTEALKSAPPVAPTHGNRTLESGEWYGEPHHSPKVPEPTSKDEKVTLIQREVGTIILDKKTGKARTLDGKPLPQQVDPLMQTATGSIMAHVIRASWSDAEWKDRWIKLFWFSGYTSQKRAEEAMRLVDVWLKAHGDPRKPRAAKVTVHG